MLDADDYLNFCSKITAMYPDELELHMVLKDQCIDIQQGHVSLWCKKMTALCDQELSVESDIPFKLVEDMYPCGVKEMTALCDQELSVWFQTSQT